MKRAAHITAIALLALLAPQPSLADQHIKLVQAQPQMRNIDVGEPGHSKGDLMLFDAKFTAEDGSEGIITGRVTTVGRHNGSDSHLFKRQSEIVLNFGDGDTLVVLGPSTYRVGSVQLDPHGEQSRAIIGGTGRFVGARGQLTTIGNEDGGYTHDVQLLD